MSSRERSLDGKAAILQGRGTHVPPASNLVVYGTEALLAVLVGVLAASLVWTLLFGSYRTPLPAADPSGIPAADGTGRATSPLSAAVLFAPGSRASAVQVETLPESRLGFALFGVRTASDPGAGSAILEAGAGGQRSIAAGTEIQAGVTLAEVYADRVVLDRRGAREVIYLTERARARQRADAGALAPVTIAGVSLTPRPLPSGGEGLQVDTAPGPLAALGIRAGDIIASVDGQPLSGTLVTSLAVRLEQGELPSSLTLDRDGERLTLQTRSNP